MPARRQAKTDSTATIGLETRGCGILLAADKGRIYAPDCGCGPATAGFGRSNIFVQQYNTETLARAA